MCATCFFVFSMGEMVEEVNKLRDAVLGDDGLPKPCAKKFRIHYHRSSR